jgi:hypothetical protein
MLCRDGVHGKSGAGKQTHGNDKSHRTDDNETPICLNSRSHFKTAIY